MTSQSAPNALPPAAATQDEQAPTDNSIGDDSTVEAAPDQQGRGHETSPTEDAPETPSGPNAQRQSPEGDAHAGGASGTPNSAAGSGSKLSPDGALSTAQGLRDRARRAAAKKDFGSAFDLATQAWELARAFPQDARLTKLAQDMELELESYAQMSNAKASPRVRDATTKLIEK